MLLKLAAHLCEAQRLACLEPVESLERVWTHREEVALVQMRMYPVRHGPPLGSARCRYCYPALSSSNMQTDPVLIKNGSRFRCVACNTVATPDPTVQHAARSGVTCRMQHALQRARAQREASVGGEGTYT